MKIHVAIVHDEEGDEPMSLIALDEDELKRKVQAALLAICRLEYDYDREWSSDKGEEWFNDDATQRTWQDFNRVVFDVYVYYSCHDVGQVWQIELSEPPADFDNASFVQEYVNLIIAGTQIPRGIGEAPASTEDDD